jgi:hypothetical protein
MDAPSRATTKTNVSSETSGEPSSPRTSLGTMEPQVPSVRRRNMEPGSGAKAGIETVHQEKSRLRRISSGLSALHLPQSYSDILLSIQPSKISGH